MFTVKLSSPNSSGRLNRRIMIWLKRWHNFKPWLTATATLQMEMLTLHPRGVANEPGTWAKKIIYFNFSICIIHINT